ncbi:MAG: single-stranded DNA-binding protein [Rikenellaceae bacterium]
MINRVILQGFVVDEPYIHVSADNKMARVRMATTEQVTLKDGTTKHITEWHTVVFWGEMANTIDAKATSGTPIYMEGALRHSTYKDKQGVERKSVDIAARKLRIMELSEVEGAVLPKVIAEQIAMRERLSNTRKQQPKKIDIAIPAEDPDNLPF